MKPSRTAADKCTVYWDYENMPIPKQANFKDISIKLKKQLFASIGCELPIEYKVYIRASKVTKAIDNDFDTNGVTVIHVPSLKPEAVDKRLMIDMMFSLYELERDNKSRAIALISGDKDFGHLLSKMHHTPPVSKSFLILLRKSNIDENLFGVVDKVIYPLSNSKCDAAAVENKHFEIKSQAKVKTISVNIINLLDAKNKFKFKGRSVTQIHAILDVICQKKGVKKKQRKHLKLFHYGKDGKENILLNHQDTFKTCKIKDGASIAWYLDENSKINISPSKKAKKVAPKKGKIQLKFQHLNSNLRFSINTKRSNTIKNLRLTCYAQSTALNIAKEHYVLYHEGIKLDDHKKISNYMIKDGDTLIWDGDETSAVALDKKRKNKRNAKEKIKVTFVHEDNIYNDIDLQSTLVNSIHNLKQKLVQKFSLKVNEQSINIMFNGEMLDRKKTLRQYGITQEATLVWNMNKEAHIQNEKEHKESGENVIYEDEDEMILADDIDIKHDTEDDEQIRIEIKNEMNATSLLFTMKKENTILDIKKMIEQRISMNPMDQILKYKETILQDEDDGDCLSRSGFKNGEKIYLSVNICNICIDIRVLGGQIIKHLPCCNGETVLQLKKEIKNRCGLNVADQILKYKTNHMLNCYHLYKYGISNGSLIYLTVKE